METVTVPNWIGHLRCGIAKVSVRSRKILREWPPLARKADVAILGCHAGGNVGDLALAMSAAGVVRRLRATPKFVPLGSAAVAAGIPAGIVCGGGVIRRDSDDVYVSGLQTVYGNEAGRLAMVGVSGYWRQAFRPQVQQFFRDVAFLSTRACRERVEIMKATGRTDVVTHPDLVFALGFLQPTWWHRDLQARVIGINIAPVFQRWCKQSSCWQVSNVYRPEVEAEDPWAARVFDEFPGSYNRMMRTMVAHYIDRGHQVVVVPFSIADEFFSRSLLRGLKARFIGYRPNVQRTAKVVAQCSEFVATRLHSHIFAILSGVPVRSIAYATKCADLWDDLGARGHSQVNPDRVVVSPSDAAAQLLADEPFCAEGELRDSWARTAASASSDAVRRVLRYAAGLDP